MEWLYIILGIVFGVPLLLIVTVMIVGRFLPERYEAKLIVELDRKPQEVWDALQDIDKNAITGKMRKRLEKWRTWTASRLGSRTSAVRRSSSRPRRRKPRRSCAAVWPTRSCR